MNISFSGARSPYTPPGLRNFCRDNSALREEYAVDELMAQIDKASLLTKSLYRDTLKKLYSENAQAKFAIGLGLLLSEGARMEQLTLYTNSFFYMEDNEFSQEKEADFINGLAELIRERASYQCLQKFSATAVKLLEQDQSIEGLIEDCIYVTQTKGSPAMLEDISTTHTNYASFIEYIRSEKENNPLKNYRERLERQEAEDNKFRKNIGLMAAIGEWVVTLASLALR